MKTEERSWDDDESAEPPWHRPGVDGAWLRSANPNTADGELQNIAAFSRGVSRLTGPRRTMVKLVVWLILIGFVFALVYGAVHIVSNR
jgi:hypothetical protein